MFPKRYHHTHIIHVRTCADTGDARRRKRNLGPARLGAVARGVDRVEPNKHALAGVRQWPRGRERGPSQDEEVDIGVPVDSLCAELCGSDGQRAWAFCTIHTNMPTCNRLTLTMEGLKEARASVRKRPSTSVRNHTSRSAGPKMLYWMGECARAGTHICVKRTCRT